MKRYVLVFILFFLSLLAVWPILEPGIFSMHDDTQVSRVIEMGRALREGQFPVRWVADLGYGYGYPIFNFYGPLPYYFGGILYAFGMPALIATKIMFGVGAILPALLLYWAVSGFGWQAAFVSSLLYLYAPYHAVQLYVRGSVGEYWILIFWPLILGAIVRKNMLLAGVATAGAILSHTTMGYVTVIALVLIFAFRPLALGLGLSAFFWLPAFFEMGYTSVSGQVSATANYADHFVCLSQLWSSQWGFGGSAPGCIDGMSFMIGKVHIVLALVSVLFISKTKMTWVGLVMIVFGVFFALFPSVIFWKILPGFSYLQYPWRFLSVASLGFALVGGNGVNLTRKSFGRTIVAILLAGLIVLMNAKWFRPQYRVLHTDAFYESALDLRWRASKISDEYLPPSIARPQSEKNLVSATIADGNGIRIVPVSVTAIDERYVVESAISMPLILQKAHFPGWRYTINGKEIYPEFQNGNPVVSINAGQSIIHMRFTDTPIRTIGNLISLVSILTVGGILYAKQRKTVG